MGETEGKNTNLEKEETDGGQILFIIPSEMELGRGFMKSGAFQTVSCKLTNSAFVGN